MANDMLERADEQVAQSIRKLSRTTSAMADALEEGTRVIKHGVKQSGDTAEELLDDATMRVKRHPVETMAATFTVGVLVGWFIGWLLARK